MSLLDGRSFSVHVNPPLYATYTTQITSMLLVIFISNESEMGKVK